jgi:hypothetical protein
MRSEFPIFTEDDLRQAPRSRIHFHSGEVPDSTAARTNVGPKQKFHDVTSSNAIFLYASGGRDASDAAAEERRSQNRHSLYN